MKIQLAALVLVGALVSSCATLRKPSFAVDTVPAKHCENPSAGKFSVLGSIPRDDSYFTEGLIFLNDKLLESTGLYDVSKILSVDLKTGHAQVKRNLPKGLYGEGLAELNGKLFQLTFKEKNVLIYDLDANLLETQDFVSTTGEGWGLTSDGKRLYWTEGDSNLYFATPGDRMPLKAEGKVEVRAGERAIVGVNELEFVKGAIYANWFRRDFVLLIDPATGCVKKYYDFQGVLSPTELFDLKWQNILNGIAYDPKHDLFYITGKGWPKILKVRFDSQQ